ncbi:MAG: hypothetical protein IKW08_07515 [Roseburia sp.]|nr:hypothetical protein [Roseburia sp.]
MNAEKRIMSVIGQVDEKYIEEAAPEKKEGKKPVWLKWETMAACLAVVMVIVLCILPQFSKEPIITPPDNTDNITANDPNIGENIPPITSEIHISMSNIFINQFDGFADMEYSRYKLETDVETIWDKNDIISYYGTDLLPAYIPDGLSASEKNAHATVYISQDGIVVEDTIFLNYYHDYYEDGSPKLTENIAAAKGFSVTISKLGIMESCCYLLPESGIKTSDIDKTAVTFGYCSMPYGPYHSETHEPSGYYDMYVAQFKKDGVEYQIVTQQMEIEELVKVVTSIIRGDANIIITQ